MERARSDPLGWLCERVGALIYIYIFFLMERALAEGAEDSIENYILATHICMS